MANGEALVQFGDLQMQHLAVQHQPINTVLPFVPVNQDQSLPLESTRSGNIFHDRFNSQITWYLPEYALAADIDASFSFSAVAQTVDTNGNPSYVATLTFSVVKVEPDDVTAYKATYPTAILQEIPLTGLSATLTTTATDPQSGQVHQGGYTAALTTDASGNAALTFNTLMGSEVLVAYYNLENGGATLSLIAQYQVWRMQRFFRPILHQPPFAGGATAGSPGMHPMKVDNIEPAQTALFWTPRPPIAINPQPPVVYHPPIQPGPPQPQPTYTIVVDQFSVALDLSKKFAAPGYARSFTVQDANGLRPIQSINDLKNFDQQQSEYSEFTALGDIPSQYPSYSRLYIGAFSRTIVAIPSIYGIVRSKDGTAVQCQAKFDSTAGGTGAATFQFAFAISPVVSPFDQFALQAALASNPQSQGFTLVVPQRMDTTQPATLSTPFQSAVTYAAGPTPGIFGLNIDIMDGGTVGSSVASANLILKQLSTSVQPYLSGSFGIALDDGYPHPVMANVVLNLSETSGTDEISYNLAADGSTLDLIDVSPLDLTIARYAIINGGTAPPVALNQKLLAQQTIALVTNTPPGAISLLVDRTLALESPFTKDALSRYVTFITEDEQAVNYQIGVVANGVDFTAMQIAQIGLVLTIPSLPQVSIPNSTLSQESVTSNAVISLPLQNAIGSLIGVISFTVKSVVAGQPDVTFTASNDFVDQPVFVLQPSLIPPFTAVVPQQ